MNYLIKPCVLHAAVPGASIKILEKYENSSQGR